jgi:arsenate reductase
MLEQRPEPVLGARKRRILFLSVRNAARSLMAAAWLRQVGGEHFDVESAGTQPAPVPHPVAVAVMYEVGIDLSAARPRSSTDLRGADYDLVIVLAPRDGAESPRLDGAREVAYWSFDDPASIDGPQQVQVFRRVRDELRTRVSLFVNATLPGPGTPAATPGEQAQPGLG